MTAQDDGFGPPGSRERFEALAASKLLNGVAMYSQMSGQAEEAIAKMLGEKTFTAWEKAKVAQVRKQLERVYGNDSAS